MISTPTNLRTYKAVLVLNNSGVTLLQRHRYHDALTTFKDASDLMSCIRDGDRKQMSDEKATIFLEKASARMSKSTRIGVGDQKKIASNCIITVIYQGECSYSDAIMTTFPELFHGFAYMLAYDEDCVDDTTDTAMLLHNFSVAIRLKVHHTGLRHHNSSGNIKMMDFAYKVERAADKILNECIATSAHDCGFYSPLRNCEETIQLAIVVVKDLRLLSQEIQQKEDARNADPKYFEQLSQLQTLLFDLRDSRFNCNLSKDATAAQAA